LAGLPAHFWDITAVNALDKVCQRLRKHGSHVEVVGLNEHGRALVSKLDLGIE
jgi:sulfate permease, SulP family